MKRTARQAQFTNKQNINPNIILPSTQLSKPHNSVNYPKVSCFGILSTDQNDAKDWRKRIMNLSDRERVLNNKLLKMLAGRTSPFKNDKVLTEAASAISNTKYSQKLGNTLKRYLYQHSQSHSHSNPQIQIHNMTFTQTYQNLNQLIEQLHKTTQQIVGTQIILDNQSNPQQVVSGVIKALKQFKNKNSSLIKISTQKNKHQIQIDME